MQLHSREQVRPLRRAEFDQLVALGAFERERLELINGTIIKIRPQGGAHASTLTRLVRLLVPRLPADVRPRIQMPFAASAVSEPEPDLAIVPAGDYEEDHPSTALLVIEVSDSSLKYDQTEKAALYAKARVAEYWIVDLEASFVEVRSAPKRGKFSSVRVVRPGDTLRPLSLPKISLSVADFFARSVRT